MYGGVEKINLKHIDEISKKNNSFLEVKTIIDENFQDYKFASMFIAFPKCNFKCFKELNLDISGCQNFKTLKIKNKIILIKYVFERYIKNPITKAIVFGGLEPFLSFNELYECILYFRTNGCEDDFVIYTGYYKHEIKQEILKLKKFKNIIVKFGRFIPNLSSKFDEVLGVNLVSSNQYAEMI